LWIWLFLMCLAAAQMPCRAADSRLAEFSGQIPVGDLVPGADHYGPVEGTPPVMKAFAGTRLVGYAFINADWVNSTGYSGQPIQIVVGLTADGKISGARLMAHHEPIVLIGIAPERIAAFIRAYVGRDVLRIATEAPSARPAVDIVSGATVTVTVIAESMVRSAIRVARAQGIGGAVKVEAPAAREIDPSHVAPADWLGLLDDGSVRHLSLSVGDVSDSFKRAGNQAAADRPETDNPAAPFVDLFVAPVSVPAIGKRLLPIRSKGPAMCAAASSIASRCCRATAVSTSATACIRGLATFAPRAHRLSRMWTCSASLRKTLWMWHCRGGCNCWRNAQSLRARRRS
jgi:NosR/NirI family nitrous oxide reductase transcriptional regulator